MNAKEKELTGYPSIDKPWLKYYSEEALGIEVPSCTVFQNVYENNKDFLEDIAIEFFCNKITYGAMFQSIDKAAKAFVNFGVKKGDIVNFVTSSTPEIIIAILALGKIGTVANMINVTFTEEQIISRVNDTEANLIIVMEQLYFKIENIIEKLCVKKMIIVSVMDSMPVVTRMLVKKKLKANISYSDTVITWKVFIKTFGDSVIQTENIYRKGQPFVMVYSSGTTGASKGIVLSHDSINATLSHYISPDFPYERGDKFLQMIPIWFSTGIVVSCLMPLCMGITVILEPNFSAESFCYDVRKYKPTMTLVATSLWLSFIKDKKIQKTDLSFLQYPITGGEQLLQRVENNINAFLAQRNCKAKILQGWGMCELGGTVASNSITHRKSGSTGFPIKGVTVAAFDMETNQELKYNRRGELRVISPARMKYYYKKKEATDEFFYIDDEGRAWGCTGDMVMLMKVEMYLYLDA